MNAITPKPATVFDLFNGHPERWIKGEVARDASKVSVDYKSANACCFCLLGALAFVYQDGGYMAAYFKASIVMPDGHAPVTFNDAPSTTFDMMLAKVKEAGI